MPCTEPALLESGEIMAARRKQREELNEATSRTYDSIVQEQELQRNFSTPFIIQLFQGILSNASSRINLYFIAILLVGILPEESSNFSSSLYTTKPKNVLNEYFVKLGWAWTFVVSSPFIILSNVALRGGSGLVGSITRILTATGVWFGSTRLFDLIRVSSEQQIDISGHCFILIWSIMFLVEESKSYSHWDYIRSVPTKQASFQDTPLKRVQRRIRWVTFLVRLFLMAMAMLSILWDVMLFSTILAYHTWTEKILAMAFATAAWLLTYHGIYTLPLNLDVPRLWE